jgi:phenylacetic acid degradation operon negative regulatory protein
VVEAGRRSAGDRNDLRLAMRALRIGELREGVWMRPDNLDLDRQPHHRAVVAAQCRMLVASPEGDPRQLATDLWDLARWATSAEMFAADLGPLERRLDDGDTTALRPGWELSAAVLRHLLADPLLPTELLPSGWPGDGLREAYDRFDAAFRRCWQQAFARS